MNGFNPQGGEEAEVGTRGKGGINFRAVFTGVVDATPVLFNPTKQQLIQIKNVPQERQQYVFEKNYVGVYKRDGKKQSRLELLLRIHPNELLARKDKDKKIIKKEYIDDYYFPISITISDEDELSKGGEGKSQKYRFINENLQSTWAETLDVVKANKKMSWFNTDTARIAKRGEVLLYNLLYAMYNFSNTKENPITGFKLGEDPTETFCDLVRGDVSSLNDLIDPDSKAFPYFSNNGEVRKIAVMLGVKESEKVDNNGDPYYNQVVYTNAYVNNCFAKEGRMLPKDAITSINSGDGFRAATQDSLKFQAYDPIKAAEKTIAEMAGVEETSVDGENAVDFENIDYAETFGDEDFG
jgi:hypothetical protein